MSPATDTRRPAADLVTGPMVPRTFVVTRRRQDTEDTATLWLEPYGGGAFSFAPGQFAMVYAFGVGDIPLSVSGTDGDRLTHTVRAVGAVSAALHGLRTGATVGVRGPFGTGWELPAAARPRPPGRRRRHRPGAAAPAGPRRARRPGGLRATERLIGSRTPRDLLYAGRHAAGRQQARVLTTVDRPDARWDGEVGVVTTLLDRAAFDPRTLAAFICGPEPMIRATATELSPTAESPPNGSRSPWNAPCTAGPATAATASSAPSCSAATARSSPGPPPDPCSR